MWTKGQLVSKAFGELALAGFVVDIQPEEELDAITTMDAMVAEWEGKGIRLGYAFSASPDEANPATPSGLADADVRPVYTNLAVAIATSYGKQLQPSTLMAAGAGLRTLQGRVAAALAKQGQGRPTTLPVGAGSRWHGNTYPFFPPQTEDPLQVSNSDDMTITPE